MGSIAECLCLSLSLSTYIYSSIHGGNTWNCLFPYRNLWIGNRQIVRPLPKQNNTGERIIHCSVGIRYRIGQRSQTGGPRVTSSPRPVVTRPAKSFVDLLEVTTS